MPERDHPSWRKAFICFCRGKRAQREYQGYIDHVIYPEETRKALSDWLRTSSHANRIGMRKKHGDIPL